MLRFLKSIGIDNIESFDMDFVCLKKQNNGIWKMDIHKNTSWSFDQLNEFKTKLINIDYPYEIIDVSKSMLQITLRRLKHVPTKNFDFYNDQECEYFSDENGSQIIAKLTKYGSYKTSFGSVNRNGARYYMDPSF